MGGTSSHRENGIHDLRNIIWISILSSFHISILSDHDLQTLVESAFKLDGHFMHLNVSRRRYLRTKHNGDAGRWIH